MIRGEKGRVGKVEFHTYALSMPFLNILLLRLEARRWQLFDDKV